MSASGRAEHNVAPSLAPAGEGARPGWRRPVALARLARPSLPSGRLAVLVWTYVLTGLAMLIALTALVPVQATIAVPFALGGLDPIMLGVVVWIAVGLATSSRGSADEGRVTIIFGVAPIVASFALGGPTAAIWVAAIGS
ncbi:MAG: hypothetical protein ABI598_00070, partial [Chloroflexota bacterium]